MKVVVVIFYGILCFFISSSVHELGHILVGLKQGFKFYWMVVGPFGLKRNADDKITFYIEKNVSLWGGLGATLPMKYDISNFDKFGYALLGGPITSLVFGMIWLPFGMFTKSIFLLLLGVMSIAMGIACLIPARNGAFYTDGGRWLRMHKNGNAKAVEMAIWNLTQNAMIQGNFEKADFDEIETLINDNNIRTKYLGRYYAYHFYKDNKDTLGMEREKAELKKLEGKVPK